MVNEETVIAGEKLLIRICDADRFGTDDTIGVVETDVASIIDQSQRTPGDAPIFHHSSIQPMPGKKTTQGTLDWSARFFPVWRMPEAQLERHIEAYQAKRELGEGTIKSPWWLEWLERYMDKPDWEAEREARRKRTIEVFSGERYREEIEALARPPPELVSGVLQFHIHQCERESLLERMIAVRQAAG